MKQAIVHSDQQRKHVGGGSTQQSGRNRLARRPCLQPVICQCRLYCPGAAGNPRAQQRIEEKRLLLTQATVVRVRVRISMAHGFNGVAACIDRFLHAKKFAGTNAACRAPTVFSGVNCKTRS